MHLVGFIIRVKQEVVTGAHWHRQGFDAYVTNTSSQEYSENETSEIANSRETSHGCLIQVS